MDSLKLQLISLFLILTSTFYAQAQETLPQTSEVDGKWFVELNSTDIGSVNTIFHFESEQSSFEAWTRKGADKDILGFWKSTLARIFTNDFKGGSLLRLTDGTFSQQQDTILLAAIFSSALGDYYFNGHIYQGQLSAELKNSQKETKAFVSGRKKPALKYPLDDYSKIVSEALDTAKNRLFNPAELQKEEWKDFEETITKKSGDLMDDVELVFAFYYFSSDLPFSHFNLTRIKEMPHLNSKPSPGQNLILQEKSSQTALLTIKSFGGSAAEVDSILDLVINRGYENLIVDLRNNAGGTVEAGLRFASRVVDTTLIGGVFLTRKWFDQHPELPAPHQIEDFPDFSQANYDLLIDGIHNQKGLLLKVQPQRPVFQGKLYILTNTATASTCEPLVHGLKTINRATAIGQTTAGAMLNGERFDLKSGFSLFVPTADYYTMDGYRIDQNGVSPDIQLEEEDPLQYTLDQLIQ